MHKRIFSSPKYPPIGGISTYTNALIDEASEALFDLVRFEPVFLNEAIAQQLNSDNKTVRFRGALASLERPLSEFMLVKYGSPSVTGERTTLELPIFESYLADIKRIPHLKSSTFIELLESIATDANKESVKLRSELNVITKPDHLGDYWQFLDWRHVKSELIKLHSFLKFGYANNLPSCFLAPVFIGAFNCIHPFRDGNGRTGRIVFNGLFQIHIDEANRFYIPMKEFMGLSSHGFDLAMRESILFGRWSTLIVYCCRVIIIMKKRLESDSNFFW